MDLAHNLWLCNVAAVGDRPRSVSRTADAPRPQRRGHGRVAWTLPTTSGSATLLRSGTDRAPFVGPRTLRVRSDVGTNESHGPCPPPLALPRCCGRGPTALRLSDRGRSASAATWARTSRMDLAHHLWLCHVAAVGDR